MRPETLLQRSPLDLAGLPGYFRGLTARDLDRVWVQAVIDCLQRDSQEAGLIPIGTLAAALVAVRECGRSAQAGLGAAPSVTPPPAPPAPLGWGENVLAPMRERLGAGIGPGREAALVDIVPDTVERARIVRAIRGGLIPGYTLRRAPRRDRRTVGPGEPNPSVLFARRAEETGSTDAAAARRECTP